MSLKLGLVLNFPKRGNNENFKTIIASSVCVLFFPEGMAYQCLLKNELLGAGIEDLKVRPYNV